MFRKKDAVGLLSKSGAGLLDHCRVERRTQSTGANRVPDEQQKLRSHEMRFPPLIPLAISCNTNHANIIKNVSFRAQLVFQVLLICTDLEREG